MDEDILENWRAQKLQRNAMRKLFGVDCAGCVKKEPKRTPTRMMPGRKCKVCGNVDRRPALTDEQYMEAWREIGYTPVNEETEPEK